MKKLISLIVAGVTLLAATLSFAETSQPLSKILTSFDFNVVGLGLNASPDYQAVPKGISSKVDATFDAGSFNPADIIAQLPSDYTVRAELSGPGFQTPLALVTKPGKAFDLPTLAILGKYTLSNIRLVDGSGKTLFGAMPQAVAIESIPDPLITSVTTRPLTTEELKERGVTFDSSNFTAYQFTAGIATQSGQIPLNLQVNIPTSAIVNIPPEQVVETPVMELPPVPDVPQVELPRNTSVLPFLIQVQEKEISDKYQIPPIPGIVVIPGNIGFLHQYFSALALVTNGAPAQSNLTIKDVQAKIVLPTGEDLTPGTDATPGDDPLRMAKGATEYFPRTMTVFNAGPDGKVGTADDVSLLHPAESGQADFTIEGLKEGTHKLEFEITATLEGLPIGPVTLKGKATGAVLVRNPEFSITMGHPSTVRSGEEYDLFITVTNTGKTPANLVTVSLDPLALSGAVFAAGETGEKSFETIAAGSAVTAKYRLKSQRTGKVTATAFESPTMKGKFILRAGVGELNIPLSPDSLILPYTSDIPQDALTAAMSLLGQAWSVATAPTGALPAEILPITKSIVSARAFDLSEAGLRIALGDNSVKALEDLAFDFIGSDNANTGFDSLRRKSSQGIEFNRALGALFQKEIETSGLMEFQRGYADKVSYRPRHISVVTSSAPVRVRITDPSGNRTGGLTADEKRRDIAYADQIPLSESESVRSTLTVATTLSGGNYDMELVADADATFDMGVVVPGANDVPQQLIFSGVQLTAGSKATVTLHPGVAGDYRLSIDSNGDGTADRTVPVSSVVPISDRAPEVVIATQIVPGFGPGGDKHGRNVALLFSQRVTKATAQNLANYTVDANAVSSVSLQSNSRMAFLLLRDGIGPFVDRNIDVSGLANNAGLIMQSNPRKIAITAKGPAALVTGAVRTARGEPVPDATVKLYQLIWYDNGFTKDPLYALFSEKKAGADGKFQFDYVLQNDDPAGPFILEAVNPATKEVGSLTTGVTFHGQQLALDIFMKARGSVSGTVRNVAGNAMAGATVQVTTLNDNRSYSATTDGTGAYSITGASVGAFSIKAVHQASLSEGQSMGTLSDDGANTVQDVVVYQVATVAKGNVAGKVLGTDGVTPRAGILVIVEAPNYRSWVRTGSDGSFVFTGVYAGSAQVTARDDATGELSVVSGVVNNGATAVLNVIMKGTGTVTGKVERGDGKSVEGLYVIARVNQITRVLQTDAQGNFTFAGITTGEVRLEVLDPRDFNRTVATGAVTLFSAGETTSVYLYVPEKALATGTIQGTVYGRTGAPLANAEVRRLAGEFSFYTYKADANGKFTIPNLPLGTYRIVGISGNEVANATATLWFDTQVKTVDLYAAGMGTVTGVTYDDVDKTIPTGADVTLVSMKPNEVGWLVYEGRFPAVVKSDPSTGRFTFTGVYQGSFTVASSNVFRPTQVSAAGSINQNGQTVTVDLSLKGSPPQPGQAPVNQPGSISGTVLNPDGTPAGGGVRVTVKIGDADVTVTTDVDGKFHFAPIIPAGNKEVVAVDPVTTRTGHNYASVPAGLDVPVTIRLLGRGSITVRALNADGTPAPGTTIKYVASTYPNKDGSGIVSDESGRITFDNLNEGSYAITAIGSFGRGGRGQITIPADQAAVTLDVKLDPSGTVTGTFLKADGVNPIGGGQIRLMRSGQVIAYATSSTDAASLGTYRIEHVPLGDFTLDGFDPINERMGVGGGRLSTDGQTATANIVVIPRGTVKGRVLNFSGTAPVAGSTINISVNGAASYNYNSVSAADGSFLFAGVPTGKFTIDASDPSNGLRGQASGNITYEGETVQAEVHIAPTGSIEGRLLMPDGVHAANNGMVFLNGGSGTNVDPATGAFRFTNLAAGKSYNLSATSAPDGLRKGAAIATVTSDGEVAVADIVLRGIGSVKGVVTVDGTPLDGAQVIISAAGASHFFYSTNGGTYRFDNIPAGPFTVRTSHPDPLVGTAASGSGTLTSEAEVVTMNLTLADVATITGKVILADGVTPSAGGGVRFTGCNRIFTAVTGSDGGFTFENIPLQCSFALELADARELGIGKYSGTLAAGQKSMDIGSIVLDDKPITVASVDPANGSVNVAITKSIKVLFSEAADPSTVNDSTVYLVKGSTRVAATLALDPDHKGVTLTPASQLSGFALYSVVVTTGVKEMVGRSIPQHFTATFTTIDNIAPTVVSISPVNGTVQVASDGVVRVTFSETVDPAAVSGIKLLKNGTEVATRLDLIQGGTVAVLTPLEPLAMNATYSVSVSGITDTLGNAMPGTSQAAFNTLDTVVPTVSALTVPANSDLIKGNSVLVTAQVADSDVAFVDFYVNDVKKSTATTAPYVMLLTLPAEGTLHLKAVAQDRVGNRGIPTILDLDVKADVPPQVTVTPPAGGTTVGTGSSLNLAVAAIDDLFAKSITLTATGEFNFEQTLTNSAGKNFTSAFTLNIPSEITGDGIIHVSVVAKDSAGNSSQVSTLTLTMRDSIAPALVSAGSIGQTTLYKPGETGSATFVFSDNIGITAVNCGVTGSGTGSENIVVSPAQKSVTRSFSFAVAPDAASNAPIAVSCTAIDAANNQKTGTVNLVVADMVKPQVVILSPAEGATVNTGSSIQVTVQATDDVSVKEIALSTTGEVIFNQSKPNLSGTSSTASFTLSVASGITGDGKIHLLATGKDAAGNTSVEAVRTLSVHDSIPPTAESLVSPGQTTLYKPGEAGTATFYASDNIGITSVTCSAGGAATGLQLFNYPTVQKQLSQPFEFQVAPGALPLASVTVTCTAYDAAGNQSAKTLNLTVADVVPPEVLHASIPEGASNVAVTSAFTVYFSEALAVSSVNSTSVMMTEVSTSKTVSGTVTLASDRKSISFKPAASLAAGTSYILNINVDVRDDAGNGLQVPYLLPFSTDGRGPGVLSVAPVDGSANVPVNTAISVTFDEPLDPASVGSRISLSSMDANVAANVTVSTDGTTVTLKPYSNLAYGRAYTLTLSAGLRDISGNASTTTGAIAAFTTQGTDPDLVGYWPLDGDYTDYSGTGSHGTPYGVTVASDHVVGTAAASFNGTSSRVTINDSATLQSMQYLTAEAWIKPAEIKPSGIRQSIISFKEGGKGFILALPEDNTNKLMLWVCINGTWYGSVGSTSLSAGNWYHVAGSFNGKEIKVFVNGKLDGRYQVTGVMANGTGNLNLGARAMNDNNWFKGSIDNVSIFKRALNDEDITERYYASLTDDRTAPEQPVLDPIPAETTSSTLIVSGRKEADASIRINGVQVVGHDASTSWQVLYTLQPGQNTLEIVSRDLPGNPSTPIVAAVNLLTGQTPDLIGLWHMDGNWLDYSGGGNYGTANSGVTFSGTRILGSSAGSFDGVDDYAQVSATVTAKPMVTVAAWVRPERSSIYSGIMTNEPLVGSTEIGYGFRQRINNKFWFTVGREGYGAATAESLTTFTPGNWYHLVGTYDGSQAKIYVNGTLEATANGSASINTTAAFRMGRLNSGNEPFKGQLDEVSIYKKAFSVSEVQSLYALPKVVITSPGQARNYAPGETGEATYTITAPQGIEKVVCTAAGAASGYLVTGAGGTDVTSSFNFDVVPNAGPLATYSVTCSCIDAKGRLATQTLSMQVADIIPPAVASSSVVDGAEYSSEKSPVSVTFNEPLASSTVNAGTVVLTNATSGVQVSGTVSLSTDLKTITFTPLQPLDLSTPYTLTIAGTVTDSAGNALGSSSTLHFTTATVASVNVTGQGTSGSPYNIPAGTYGEIAISGSYVVFAGAVVADRITLVNNSTLVHKQTGVTGAEQLDITASIMTIDGTSKIDVTGRGYQGGQNIYNQNGRTTGNRNDIGSSSYNSGSYGGLAGLSGYGGTLNAVYGDLTNPIEGGSGGGSSGSDGSVPGGNGGGLVRLQAATLNLNGVIIADGAPAASYTSGYGTKYYSGAGSGGGVWLSVGTLSGVGYITARGGASGYTSNIAGGGGGRIAIYYDTMSLPLENIMAYGGKSMDGSNADRNGGAGTVYLKNKAKDKADLALNNGGVKTSRATTVPGGSYGSVNVADGASISMTGNLSAGNEMSLSGVTLTVTGSFTPTGNLSLTNSTLNVSGSITVPGGLQMYKSNLTLKDSLKVYGDMTLENQSVLSHYVTTSSAAWKLDIEASTVTIDASSKIDVTGKGYLGGAQGDNGNSGRTNGNRSDIGSTYGGSASYGGLAGTNPGSSATINAVYGDLANPNEWGSGGAAYYNSGYGTAQGSNGGGLVRLKTGTLTLNGGIFADGLGGGSYPYSNGYTVSYFYSGAGSGGGVWLDVGTLAGNGSITARGGASTLSNTIGGGGGGRIAIYYDALSLPLVNIKANGGKSMDGSNAATNGGAGTVYLKDKAKAKADLSLGNGGFKTSNATVVPGGSYGSVSVTDGAAISMTGNLSAENEMALSGVTLSVGGSFTVPGNLSLNNSTVTVNAAMALNNNLTLANNSTLNVSGSLTIPGGLQMDKSNLTLKDSLKVNGDINLVNQSVLSHYGSTTTGAWKLDIDAPTVTIDASSKIDVTGKGYLGGWQNGNGETGRTNGNRIDIGSTTGNSASYGGLAGTYANYGTLNAVYGDLANPMEWGSGGGGYYSSGAGTALGGNGGGLVRLKTGTLTLNGGILADGAAAGIYQYSYGYSYYYLYSGAGSGGGVWLDVGTLAGSGSITARGGASTYSNTIGGGGGGRIAIYYDTLSLPVANIKANGGKSTDGINAARNGGAGTIYLKDKAKQKVDLFVANAGVKNSNATTIPGGTYGTVSVTDGAAISMTGNVSAENEMVLNGVTLSVGGSFTVPGNISLNDSTVTVNAAFAVNNNLTLTNNSTLNVSGSLTVPGALQMDKSNLTLKDSLKVYGDVTLVNQSVLSHYAVTTTGAWKLDIDAPTVTIDASSKIDVTGKGYLGGWQNGNGETGRTNGNRIDIGSTTGNSGSYGGLAGYYANSGTVNAVYGDLTNPQEWGSGGGGYYSSGAGTALGGNGGGLVRLKAGTLTLNGSIFADGIAGGFKQYSNGYTYYYLYSGAGSGGGIWLDVGTLSGSGSITARGGASTYSNTVGGGGGGRIAIYYDTLSLPVANIKANGGISMDGSNADRNGGAGTIYLLDRAKGKADLTLANADFKTSLATTVPGGTYNKVDISRGASANMTGSLSLDPNLGSTGNLSLVNSTLYVSGSLTVPGALQMDKSNLTIKDNLKANGDVTLSNQSVLSHYSAISTAAWKLDIDAANVTIDATSKIDVTGRGYLGGQNGNETNGRTAGNRIDIGSSSYNSASYGGRAGISGLGGTSNAMYGDLTNPLEFGSGGGADYSSSCGTAQGGSGGGLVRVKAGTFTLNGSILADGSPARNQSCYNGYSTYYLYSGAGSGGGVWIDAVNLAGTGSITARGGASTYSANIAGGGGGRVAIYYDTMSLPAANIKANGGKSMDGANADRNGGAGTIYMKDRAKDKADLAVGNAGVKTTRGTAVPGGSYGTVAVTDGASLSATSNLSAGNEMLLSGVTMSVAGSFSPTGNLSLVNSTLNVSGVMTLPGTLLMDKSNLTINDTFKSYGDVTLTNQSVLSHYAATTTGAWKVDIDVPTLTIDATSKIDVTGKGYLGGQSGSEMSGRTNGNRIDIGSTSHNSGSYGGVAGASGYGGTINAVYGDLTNPSELGSGGGADSNNYGTAQGGNGGGLVRVKANTVNLNGSILADGTAGGTFHYSIAYYGYDIFGAAGSGGGVWLDVGTLAGSGSIMARGGASTASADIPGGGGGRIAIYYDTLSLPLANIKANGGKSMDGSNPDRNGGVGTVYLKDRAKDKADIVLANAGIKTSRATTVPGGSYGTVAVTDGSSVSMSGNLSAANEMSLNGVTMAVAGFFSPTGNLSLANSTLNISGDLTVPGSLQMDKSNLTVMDTLKASGDITLSNQSVLSHYAATSTAAWKLDIDAATVAIDASSKIDVTGRGYLGGQSGTEVNGRTTGNRIDIGSTSYNSASFGGPAGASGYGGTANAVYGDMTNPADFGSGGGAEYNSSYGTAQGGKGGGLVRLKATALTLNGSIIADGMVAGTKSYTIWPSGYGYSLYGGAGSGGGVRVDVGTLSGTGSIMARGGASTASANIAGGGGGRIAIYYDTMSLPLANIKANGGKSMTGGNPDRNGGAGTIYLKQNAYSKGDVIVDNDNINTNRKTPIPGGDYRLFDVVRGALINAQGTITNENVITLKDSNFAYSGDYSVPRDLTLLNATVSVAGGVTVPGNLIATNSTLSVRNNLNVTGTITAQSGSLLTHAGATSSEAFQLAIQSGPITVDGTSRIGASGKGYLGGWQDDNIFATGRTFGNVIEEGSAPLNGGGHGGLGGYLADSVFNASYGSFFDPRTSGSGGGGGLLAGALGGNGGGVIRIKAPSLSLNGSIDADGGDSLYGGGSGGSIFLDVPAISGSGTIRAKGGAGGTAGEGSGGGGGRVALYYTTSTLPTANISAAGGKGFDGTTPQRNGGAGTVYLKGASAANADLVVDNRGLDSRSGSTLLGTVGRGRISILTSTALTAADVTWKPGTLAGSKINPNVNQEQYFTIIDNTADTLFINATEGNLNSVAAPEDSFSGVILLNSLKFLGKARGVSEEQLKITGELLLDDASLTAATVNAGSITTNNGGILNP